jgi:pimeloyl-ACP methyl ester carboxylesterase
MPYALNQGTKLYWEEHGSGPPILLIMGLSFTHEMWFRVLSSFTANYRVILFDNRGVGSSDVPRGLYSMPKMASDAVAVLDAAGVSAAHVIGASMGGMIAQELALRHPGRVRSLVLGSTSHGGLLARWPHFRYRPRGIRWSKATRLERENALIPLLYASTTPRERIDEDFRVRCQCKWSHWGFLGQFAGILTWSSYWRLPRIQIPPLVIHGAEDHRVPAGNGRVLASRIPGAEFLVIPQAAHLLITDQPELSTEAILAFLAKVKQNSL